MDYFRIKRQIVLGTDTEAEAQCHVPIAVDSNSLWILLFEWIRNEQTVAHGRRQSADRASNVYSF